MKQYILTMCMLIAAAVSANCQTSVVKPGERPEVLIETTMGNVYNCTTRLRSIATTSLS